jgi:hypothetical protein
VNADRLSGGVLFLFALGVGWEARKLPFGTVSTPDSGFFPLSLAVILAALSALIVIGSWLPEAGATPAPSWQGAGRVAIAVATLMAYVAALDALGYLVTTGLVMLVYLRGLERLRWGPSLAITVGSVVISYLLFRRLGVPLPAGIAPF